MFRFLLLILIPSLMLGCQTTDNLKEGRDFEYLNDYNTTDGSIKGRVLDPEIGEGAPGVTIMLEGTSLGTMSDMIGDFYLQNIPPGTYNLLMSFPGYQTVSISVEVQAGKILRFKEDILLEFQQVQLEKPMIYLYPEETTEVVVELDYKGELTHTYPKSDGTWKVQAEIGGILADSAGQNYYGLYWEGISQDPIVPDCGSVVARDSLIPFLEASLDQLGLNYKEANEFIVYWLPRLEQSDYNLIYFAEEDYTDQAKLRITPEPDNVIRVMMGFVPLKTPIEIVPQILPERPERNGFTVVEWGGTECTHFEL